MFHPVATVARLGIGLVCVFLLGLFAAVPLRAAEAGSERVNVERSGRFLALGIGKSVVIDLPRDAKDVLVANPGIANAVVRSARRAYLIGVAVGQTTVVFFDGDGRQIVAYDIEVGRDAAGVRDALRRIIPSASIRVDAVNDSVVLSGVVANALDAQNAFDTAAKLVGDSKKVVNGLVIKDKEQVLLKVSVAEVQRSVIKQLGIDLNGASIAIGTTSLNFNINNPFSVQGSPITSTSVAPTFHLPNGGSITATLRAMEQTGVLRTLAEPNISAVSGESAKFLAGGEFPIPSGISCTGTVCTPQITFKQFGILLEFLPVVLSEGRISLRVATEVSELTSEGAAFGVPALKVRRASSTVEVPSGGAMVLAGLIQEQTKQNINGLPGLMNLPVLGGLFKSRDYQNGLTELVIIATPYLAQPVARQALSRPDDGFANASDPATIFLNQVNRVYGTPGAVEGRRSLHGNYGFILD
jgi:pilus assembly protein CpaC